MRCRFYIVVYILLFVSLFYRITAAKEVFGTLNGEVLDSRTSHVVRGAVVTLLLVNRIDTTDTAGQFRFTNIPVGRWDVEVKSEGYQSHIYPSVLVKSGENKRLQLKIKKEEKIQQLDKMVVTGRRILTKTSEQTNSVLKISRDEVLNSPGSSQDVNRIIQTLPSSIGGKDEGFNLFLVRGGDGNENVFIIDDIEVNNISHWGVQYNSGGAIGKLHTDFIRNIDFYAGGLPAKYAPRISSVSDIHLREGSKSERKYQIDMNMAGAGMFLEGPIVREKSSYMVNARVSFLDIMDTFLDLSGVPKYQNGQMKIVWDINQDNKLITNFLVGHETIVLQDDELDAHVEDEGKHAIGGLQWIVKKNRGINKLLISGIYHSFEEKEILEDRVCDWEYNVKHKTIQLKDDLTLFTRERDLATCGFVIQGKEYNDRLANDFFYFYAGTDSLYHYSKEKPTEYLVIIDSTEAKDIDTSLIGYRIGAHAGYTLFINRLKLYMGLRNDYFTLAREHGLSPRIACALNLDNIGTFSLSGGLYYQYPAYITLLEDSVNLWDLELQRNGQIVLGYEKQLSEVTILGVETYFKYYDREPLYLLDTLNNEIDLGEREIEVNADHYSDKKVYGLEIFLHKKRLDKFYYQFSYSIYNAIRKYENKKWYNDDNNLRNSANIILGSNFHKNHRVSLRFDISEGYPYTPINVMKSKQYKQTLYDISEGYNYERRDPRIKVSFRYDNTLFFRWGNITSYFEVQNIFNQKDIYHEFIFGEKFPEAKVKKIMSRGIFPIGGLTIDF